VGFARNFSVMVMYSLKQPVVRVVNPAEYIDGCLAAYRRNLSEIDVPEMVVVDTTPRLRQSGYDAANKVGEIWLNLVDALKLMKILLRREMRPFTGS
jgi:hypothetical protein